MKRKAAPQIDRNRSVIDVFEHVVLGLLATGTASHAASQGYGPERKTATWRVGGTPCPKRRRSD
jgi:hypothetical protein